MQASGNLEDGQPVGNSMREPRWKDLVLHPGVTKNEVRSRGERMRAPIPTPKRNARLRRFRILLITDLDRLTREGAAAGFGYLVELDRYDVRVVSLGQS